MNWFWLTRRFGAPKHYECSLMGFFRVFLALCVIQAHTDRILPLWFPDFNGREAVQAFYVISGFYIAMILNLKYVDRGQTATFYVNRILRLWPPYLVVALLTALLMFRLGYLSAMIAEIQTFPLAAQILIAVSNAFVVGQDALWFFAFEPGSISFAPFGTTDATNGYKYALIVVMFSVSIEAIFYAAAPFLVRKLQNALCFAAMGLAYYGLLRLIGENRLAYTYHLFLSAIWFFAIGVLAAHVYIRYRRAFTVHATLMLFPTIVAAVVVILIGKKFFYPEARMAYASLAIACVLPVLHTLSQRVWIDRTIGELSYGMYLVHLPTISACDYFWGGMRSVPLAAISMVAALLLYIAIEHPIDKLRQQLVARKSGETAIRQAPNNVQVVEAAAIEP